MTQVAQEIPAKSIEDSLKDWESSAFGFGYGSGEPHVIPALRTFLECCNGGDYARSYDFQNLEAVLTPAVAWLLINVLGHADAIEYGTSPRYGWLTDHGQRLRDFMLSKSADELIDIVCSEREGYSVCYPTVCNCGPNGYIAGRLCPNPFWPDNRGIVR